ncbi:hypothetical protein CYMTET_38897, partial [Cymbomonas tetramitiformis]
MRGRGRSAELSGLKATLETWKSCEAFGELSFDLMNEEEFDSYFNEDTKLRFHNLGNFTGGDITSDYLRVTLPSSPYVKNVTRQDFDYGFLGYTDGSKCVFMAYEALDYELTEYGSNAKFTVAVMMKINYDPELNRVTYVYVYYDEPFLEYFFGKLDTEATSDMICGTLETSCRSTWDNNGLADKDDCLARLGEMNLFTSGTKHEQYFDGYDRGCRMVHSVLAASSSDYCQALSFSAEEGYPMCQESEDLPCCATISTGEAIFDEVEFVWFTQFKQENLININNGYKEVSDWPVDVEGFIDTWSSCSSFYDLYFELSNEDQYGNYFNDHTKFRFHNLGNFTGGDTLSDYLKLTTESSPYVASITRTQFDTGFLGYTDGSKCVFMAYEALDYELTEYGSNAKFTVAVMMKINYDPELNRVTYVYVYYDEPFLEYFFGKLDTEATSDMICDTLETSCRSTWDSNGLADKDDCLARLGEMNLFTSGTKHEQYFDGYDRGCRMVHSVLAASSSDYCQALSFSAEEGYPMCQESADLPCCATISTGEAIFDEVEFYWFTQFKADYKIDISNGYNEASGTEGPEAAKDSSSSRKMLSEVSNTLDTWSTCSAFNDVDFSLSNEAEYDTYFNEDTNFRFHNLGNFTGGDTLSDYLKLTTTSGPYVASLTRTQFDYGFLGYTEGSKCVFMAYEALDYELTEYGSNAKFTVAVMMKINYDPELNKVTYVYVYYDEPFLEYFFSKINTQSTSDMICDTLETSCRSTWDSNGLADKDDCLARLGEMNLFTSGTKHEQYFDGYDRGCRMVHSVLAASNSDYCQALSFSAEEGTGEAIFDEVEFYWFTQFKVDYKIDIYNGYEENSEWPESIATTLQTWSTCQAFDDLEFDLSNEAKFSTYFNDDTKFRFHNLGNFTGGNTLSDYLKLTTESSPYVASITRTQFDTGFLGYTDGSKCVFMAYEALDYELTEYGSNAKFTVAVMMKINYDPELNRVTYVYVYYDEPFLEYFFGKLDTEATSDMICDTLETSCRSTWDSNGLADKDDCLARLGEMNLFTSGTKHEQYFDGYDRGCRMVHSVLAASSSDYCQALSFSAEEGYPMCQESADLPCCATISTGEAIFDEVEFYWFTQFKADYKIDISNGYNEASDSGTARRKLSDDSTIDTWSSCSGFNDMNFSLSSEAEYATYFNEDTILRLHNLGLFTGDTVVSDYLKLTVDSSPYVDSLTRLDFDTGFLGYTDGSKCVFMAYEVLEYKLTDLGGKAKFN